MEEVSGKLETEKVTHELIVRNKIPSTTFKKNYDLKKRNGVSNPIEYAYKLGT